MTAPPTNSPRFSPLSIGGLALWVAILVALSLWMGQQAYRWLPVQASTAAPLVDGLFSFETAVGTFVFLGVISVMAWVVLMHRAEKYDETDAEPIEGNTRLEVIWTAIPFILVMAIAYDAIQVNTRLGVLGPMEHIHQSNPVEQVGGYPGDSLPAEQVEVIARQWSWEFRYPSSKVSSTELHLVLDQPVTFRLVSEDVLHGFYIPAFRLKQDVVRDGGLPAHSIYTVEASAPVVQGIIDGVALVRVKLMTGRTHQIRVHLAVIGHAVLADRLYGRETRCSIGPLTITTHLLHAWQYAFVHPTTQAPVTVTAPLPAPFQACVQYCFGVLGLTA